MFRSAESVRAGHPDKLADFIADTIVDEAHWQDPASRAAIEVLVTKHLVVVAGELTCAKRFSVRDCVVKALAERGYKPWRYRIRVCLHSQSADIADGVSESLEARGGERSGFVLTGAGDQGTVYGYATAETKERLPLPLVLAHRICRRLDRAFESKLIKGLGVDGKAQVSVEYDAQGVPKRVATVVVSAQHDPFTDLEFFRDQILTGIIQPACEDLLPVDDDTEILVNPSGRFEVGGPDADTGLTGRKLMVDTYGGLGPHGGGAFSGKDATKVDRTGAYMARMIARSVVDAGLADEAEVAISYAIGKADPVAFWVDTLGTGKYADRIITEACQGLFELRPAAMIETLGLDEKLTHYAEFSAYGHFRNSLYATWEKTHGKAYELREAVVGK